MDSISATRPKKARGKAGTCPYSLGVGEAPPLARSRSNWARSPSGAPPPGDVPKTSAVDGAGGEAAGAARAGPTRAASGDVPSGDAPKKVPPPAGTGGGANAAGEATGRDGVAEAPGD